MKFWKNIYVIILVSSLSLMYGCGGDSGSSPTSSICTGATSFYLVNTDTVTYEVYKDAASYSVIGACKLDPAACAAGQQEIQFIKFEDKFDCSSFALNNHTLDIRQTISGSVVIHDTYSFTLHKNSSGSYELKIEGGKFKSRT